MLMPRLPEVQQAKELMNEAMEWSTFRWLWEKQKVRDTADRANAALERLEKAVKAKWADQLKTAYRSAAKKSGKTQVEKEPGDPQVMLLVERVLEADRVAHRARMDAEDTFDRAEKQMSTSLAVEGCKKAIRSWELHEKAIRRAESVSAETSALQ
jgi:hypothetical protein